MIYVFYCNNLPLWTEKDELSKLVKLPEGLSQKIKQYYAKEDRQIRIRSKLLLLQSLQILGFQKELKDLKSTSFGKPFFIDGPHFNLSHSGNLVVCIVSSDGQVGIDTEVYGSKDVEEYLSFVPADSRLEIEASANQAKAFLDYWTKYEASVKAAGKGLFIPIDQVQMSQKIVVVEDKKWYTSSVALSEENTTSIASELPIEGVKIEEIVL